VFYFKTYYLKLCASKAREGQTIEAETQYGDITVADLERAEPAPPSPRGRRTDAVTHGTPDILQRYYIMALQTWYSEYSK